MTVKVVLDTNVLITAFKDEYSYQKRIIDEVISGRIQAFANHETLMENKLILDRLIEDESYKRELHAYFSQVNIVKNRRTINIISDKEDNKILESAVEASADYLVTEDKVLLELRAYKQVRIVDPVLAVPRFFRDRFANALGKPETGNWKIMRANNRSMDEANQEIINFKKRLKAVVAIVSSQKSIRTPNVCKRFFASLYNYSRSFCG